MWVGKKWEVSINRLYQLKNYFNIRIYIIPIWFYFNGISLTVSISASIFTFQYGSTIILRNTAYQRFLVVFTFQYGSTLMDITYTFFRCCKDLYIPIWFYFNRLATLAIGIQIDFTFQYGSTLISESATAQIESALFTFQYGSTLMGKI